MLNQYKTKKRLEAGGSLDTKTTIAAMKPKNESRAAEKTKWFIL